MAVFYVDSINGKDRAVGTNAVASNPSGTTVLITYPQCQKHDLNTGDEVVLKSFTTYLNGTRTITVVDDYSFTLDGIAWTTTRDPNGICTPVIGPPNASTWALAVRKLVSIPSASINAGDEIRFAKTADPISIGNVLWTQASPDLVTQTPLTKEIDPLVGGTFTTVSGVTLATNTSRKVGASSLTINPGAVTGKLAYRALPSTLDLSSYTKINFYVGVISGSPNTFRDTNVKICLCSDSLGNTPVNTFVIPYNDIVVGATNMRPIEIDFVAALGSSINSIAFYRDNTGATLNFMVNHLIATNTISLLDLIGKSTSIFSEWFTIKSIVNDVIILDRNQFTNTGSNNMDETENVECYIRRGAFLAEINTSVGSLALPAKTFGNEISERLNITGGWNTSTNIQDGETWIDNLFRYNSGLYFVQSTNGQYVERLGLARFTNGIYFNGNSVIYSQAKQITIVDCTIGYAGGNHLLITDCKILNCSTYGMSFSDEYGIAKNILIKNQGNQGSNSAINSTSDSEGLYLENIEFFNCLAMFNTLNSFSLINATLKHCTGGFNSVGGGNLLVNVVAENSNLAHFNFGTPTTIIDCEFIPEARSYVFLGRHHGKILNFARIAGLNLYGKMFTRVASPYNVSFTDGAIFYSDYYFGTTKGYWEVRTFVLGLMRGKLNNAFYEVGEVRVTEGVETTIGLWVRKRYIQLTDISGTGYSIILRAANNYGIISADVETAIPYMTPSLGADANFPTDYLSGWFHVSLTFTPIRTGVVLVELQAYQDKTHYLQFSSLSVTP